MCRDARGWGMLHLRVVHVHAGRWYMLHSGVMLICAERWYMLHLRVVLVMCRDAGGWGMLHLRVVHVHAERWYMLHLGVMLKCAERWYMLHLGVMLICAERWYMLHLRVVLVMCCDAGGWGVLHLRVRLVCAVLKGNPPFEGFHDALPEGWICCTSSRAVLGCMFVYGNGSYSTVLYGNGSYSTVLYGALCAACWEGWAGGRGGGHRTPAPCVGGVLHWTLERAIAMQGWSSKACLLTWATCPFMHRPHHGTHRACALLGLLRGLI